MLAWLSVWGKVQICICPADATATHYILLQEIQIGFGITFLVPAHPDKIQSRKMVLLEVVIVV